MAEGTTLVVVGDHRDPMGDHRDRIEEEAEEEPPLIMGADGEITVEKGRAEIVGAGETDFGTICYGFVVLTVCDVSSAAFSVCFVVVFW